jgi:hypothetical protein
VAMLAALESDCGRSWSMRFSRLSHAAQLIGIG